MNADLRRHVAAIDRAVGGPPVPGIDETLQIGAQIGAQWALDAAIALLEADVRTERDTERENRHPLGRAPSYGDIARAEAAALRAEQLERHVASLRALLATIA